LFSFLSTGPTCRPSPATTAWATPHLQAHLAATPSRLPAPPIGFGSQSPPAFASLRAHHRQESHQRPLLTNCVTRFPIGCCPPPYRTHLLALSRPLPCRSCLSLLPCWGRAFDCRRRAPAANPHEFRSPLCDTSVHLKEIITRFL
jgi:hypothetical protein